jgi:polyphosphate kinase
VPTSTNTSGVIRLVDALAAEPARPAPPAARRRDLAETPPHPGTAGPVPADLAAPELLLNRELTYLNFCWRVLREAEDARVPLLERLKFVAIVSANIDEFFQKRIGGLKQQVGAGLTRRSPPTAARRRSRSPSACR